MFFNKSATNRTIMEEEILRMQIYMIMKYIGISFTISALCYATLSWNLLKSFNVFQNFVLVNAITANVFRFVLLEISSVSWIVNYKEIYELQVIYWSFMYYFFVVNQCWLLVFCYHIYFKHGMYFHSHIKDDKMLIILNWVVPYIFVLIFIFSFLFISDANRLYKLHVTYAIFICLPSLFNIIMYVIAIKSHLSNTPRRGNFLIKATLICLAKSMTLLHLIGFVHNSVIIEVIRKCLIEYFDTIAIDLYIIYVAKNRGLWREWINELRG